MSLEIRPCNESKKGSFFYFPMRNLIHEDQVRMIFKEEYFYKYLKENNLKYEEVLQVLIQQVRENNKKRYPPKKKWYQKRIIIK